MRVHAPQSCVAAYAAVVGMVTKAKVTAAPMAVTAFMACMCNSLLSASPPILERSAAGLLWRTGQLDGGASTGSNIRSVQWALLVIVEYPAELVFSLCSRTSDYKELRLSRTSKPGAPG